MKTTLLALLLAATGVGLAACATPAHPTHSVKATLTVHCVDPACTGDGEFTPGLVATLWDGDVTPHGVLSTAFATLDPTSTAEERVLDFEFTDVPDRSQVGISVGLRDNILWEDGIIASYSGFTLTS
jgi:hypothetical protein